MQNPLDCPICFNAYNLEENQPHIVPSCGHTSCLSCIQRYINQNLNPTCPLCKNTDQYGDVKKSVPNEALVSLVREKGRAQGKVKKIKPTDKKHPNYQQIQILKGMLFNLKKDKDEISAFFKKESKKNTWVLKQGQFDLISKSDKKLTENDFKAFFCNESLIVDELLGSNPPLAEKINSNIRTLEASDEKVDLEKEMDEIMKKLNILRFDQALEKLGQELEMKRSQMENSVNMNKSRGQQCNFPLIGSLSDKIFGYFSLEQKGGKSINKKMLKKELLL